ncbi:MAG: cell division protein FtsA, partial [Bacillota bacterium]|nr:cell division protein FtsA [Bacillota bacterium]
MPTEKTNKTVKKGAVKNTGSQSNSKQSLENDKLMMENLEKMNRDEIIFSLDIGTRTVVGIVGYQEKDKFKVAAAEVVEHKSRAMLNGQIHDIEKVAEVAAEVRDKLEKRTGLKLDSVAIAAAGRVLKTCEVKVEREIDPTKQIERELVNGLEMEGIQKAQSILDESAPEAEHTQFYCVGYSVVNYYLNGYVITNLLDHKGKTIAAQILATFLPHVVVDSLYTVMNKIGLEVLNLTLEPIAAINVTIPTELRLLNLCLVDIGAGTSDIAITRDGSVVAYAMAPFAGDEITERIARQYLLDFNTAEKIKTSLSKASDNVSFKDIMGKNHVVKVTKILEDIKPSIENLADIISQKILELNNKATNAVFLIGGGSQIPGLTGMIAENLKLPSDRVALRGRENINNIKFNGKKLSGPEAITPIGIAVTAQMQRGHDFLSVTVNGKRIRLFNSKKLTVADSLVLIGFDPNNLIGRTGKSLKFSLNGDTKIIKGEFGEAAKIFVNGSASSLDTILNTGDEIKIEPAIIGRDAEAKVSDFVNIIPKKRIIFNGSETHKGTIIFINGTESEGDAKISNGDSVLISSIEKLSDLYERFEIDIKELKLIVNGEETEINYILEENDIIEIQKREAGNLNIRLKQIEKLSSEYNSINKAIDEEINKEINNEIKEEIDGEIKEEVNGEINTETKEEIIEETNGVIKECINEAIDQAAFTNGRLNGQNILKSSDLNTEMASKLQNRPDFLLKNPGGVCVTIN